MSSSKRRQARHVVACHRRKLVLESLETRHLLAGNVTFSLVNGVLTITGDAQANEIFVGDLGNQRFSIRGLAGTTVGGNSATLFTSAPGNETLSIVVNLGDGNDRFLFSSDSDWQGGAAFSQGWSGGGFKPLLHDHGYGELAGNLIVNLGNGSDTAVITGSAATGIGVAGGDDTGDDGIFVRTRSTMATGPINIVLGEGNDYTALSLENVTGNVSVTGAGGNDTVLLAFRTAANLLVDAGGGNDAITIEGGNLFTGQSGAAAPTNGTQNTVDVRSGQGNDTVLMTQLFANSLVVDAGLGKDDVTVRGVNLRGDATIRGGGTLGSSVALTDYTRLSMGRIDGVLSRPDVTTIETRIGGSVTINFDFEPYIATPGAPSAPQNSVTVGEQYALGPTDSFHIGSNLQVFGTIYEDVIAVKPLSAASIHVDAGYGEDSLTVRGINVTGNVELLLGNGNDRKMTVGEAGVEAPPGINYSIAAGGEYSPVHIGGDLMVDYGDGNEQNDVPAGGATLFRFEDFYIGGRGSGLTKNFVVSGLLRVSGGSGSNDLKISAARFGRVEVRLGQEAPTEFAMEVVRIDGSATVFGGIARDQWKLNAFDIRGDLSLFTGDGNDSILLNGSLQLPSNVGGSLLIDSGAGHDQVQIGFPSGQSGNFSTFIGDDLTIRTETGDDKVSLQQVFITDALMTQLGDGDDSLWMNNVVAQSGEVDGAADADTLSGSYTHELGDPPLVRRGFETDSLSEVTAIPSHG